MFPMSFRRRDEPRSMLLPPDWEERRAAERRARRSALLRSPWTRGLSAACLIVVLVVRPAPVDGSFSVMLGQVTAQVNILIDQWEKHTRILEDHLDKVSGVMQPFSELHAGVRELTDLSGLRSLLSLGRAYRASLLDPACFRYPVGTGCTLVQDFVPPEVRQVQWMGQYAIDDGMYTAEQLERYAHGTAAGEWSTISEVLNASGVPVLGDLADTTNRTQRTVWNARWEARRVRSISSRYRHVGRQFLHTGYPGRDPADCPGFATGGAVPADATLMDQAAAADCLDPLANADQPLEQAAAHVSEVEADTLQTASTFGVVDMAALELEQAASGIESRNRAEESAEAARRRKLGRLRNTLPCVAPGGGAEPTLAYADGEGGCGSLPDPVARFEAAMLETCRVPLNPRDTGC